MILCVHIQPLKPIKYAPLAFLKLSWLLDYDLRPSKMVSPSSSSKSLLEWLRLAEPLQSKVWLAVLMTYDFLLTLICVAALDSCSLAYVSGPRGKLYMGKLCMGK